LLRLFRLGLLRLGHCTIAVLVQLGHLLGVLDVVQIAQLGEDLGQVGSTVVGALVDHAVVLGLLGLHLGALGAHLVALEYVGAQLPNATMGTHFAELAGAATWRTLLLLGGLLILLGLVAGIGAVVIQGGRTLAQVLKQNLVRRQLLLLVPLLHHGHGFDPTFWACCKLGQPGHIGEADWTEPNGLNLRLVAIAVGNGHRNEVLLAKVRLLILDGGHVYEARLVRLFGELKERWRFRLTPTGIHAKVVCLIRISARRLGWWHPSPFGY